VKVQKISTFLTMVSLNFVENVGLINQEWHWHFFSFVGLLNLVFVKKLEFVVVGMRTVVAMGMGMPVLKVYIYMYVSEWVVNHIDMYVKRKEKTKFSLRKDPLRLYKVL